MKVRKTYESPNSVVANWTLIVCGRPRILNFEAISEYEGSRTGRGSILSTDDENLQNAIENSRLFGTRIRLLKTDNVEEEKPATKNTGNETSHDDRSERNEMTVIPTSKVDSPNGAREYLHEKYGIEMRKMPNLKSIANAAKENNVVFECLNK